MLIIALLAALAAVVMGIKAIMAKKKNIGLYRKHLGAAVGFLIIAFVCFIAAY